jgi:hypothetical protein
VVASSQDGSTQDSSTLKEWDLDIPLDDQLLTHDQIKKVRQMFREECTSLSQNDDDIGDVPKLQLEVELLDKEPVRRTYTQFRHLCIRK